MDMFLLGLAVGAGGGRAFLFGVMAVARAGSVGRAFWG